MSCIFKLYSNLFTVSFSLICRDSLNI